MAQYDSLFGPSVEDVRAAINQENQIDYGTSPYSSLAKNIGTLANQGFMGLAEMAGGGDPRIQKAKKMQEVKQYVQENVKGNDIVSYYEALSDAFKKFGMADEAFRVDTALEKIKNERTDRALKSGQLQSLDEERKSKQKEREFSHTDQGQLDAYLKGTFKDASTESKIEARRAVEKGIPVSEALYLLKDKDTSKYMIVKEGTGQAGQYRNRIVDAAQGKVVYEGSVYTEPDRSTTIHLPENKYESEFMKELGKEDAKYYSQLREKDTTAQKTLNVLNNVEPLINNMYTGAFAEWKYGAQRFLSALGATNTQVEKGIADTKGFQAAVKELVLGQIKNLGSGTAISDTDRKYVDSMMPQITDNPQAMRDLIGYMKRRAGSERVTSNEGMAFARKHNGFHNKDTGETWNKVPVTPPALAKDDWRGHQKAGIPIREWPIEALKAYEKEKAGK